jgi:hypothetical protein
MDVILTGRYSRYLDDMSQELGVVVGVMLFAYTHFS